MQASGGQPSSVYFMSIHRNKSIIRMGEISCTARAGAWLPLPHSQQYSPVHNGSERVDGNVRRHQTPTQAQHTVFHAARVFVQGRFICPACVSALCLPLFRVVVPVLVSRPRRPRRLHPPPPLARVGCLRISIFDGVCCIAHPS